MLAEYIRNKATKVSRAVTRIDALYRWALTGTPVTNSLADLYPLFRFLQLKPCVRSFHLHSVAANWNLYSWYDWARYRENVITYEKKNPEVAGRKAQAILRTVRRLHGPQPPGLAYKDKSSRANERRSANAVHAEAQEGLEARREAADRVAAEERGVARARLLA